MKEWRKEEDRDMIFLEMEGSKGKKRVGKSMKLKLSRDLQIRIEKKKKDLNDKWKNEWSKIKEIEKQHKREG